MKNQSMTSKLFALILTTALVFGVSACGSSSAPAGKPIIIGSKPFTEGVLLSELAAQLIEGNTSLKVDRKFNLGGTIVAFNALKNGDLDLYPEYTGTGLVAILKQPVVADADKAYEIVQKEFNSQYKIKWLKPLGFNNTYAMAVPENFAAQNNLRQTSDLARITDQLIFGAEQDFFGRADGYDGFTQAYGFKFKNVKQMEIGLKYKAIANKEVNVINAFSTDGLLITHKLRVLVDDKKYFPPYYGAFLIRMGTLEKHPELEAVLDKLAGKLKDGEMQKLNFEVDQEKKDPAAVVNAFLKAKGLVK
ncbi:MAG: substrate-binding region of ABC-type glycine betaine transport system [Firmicutes bacterium]|nr:substrate-binding region of ABC-type glycine betaine transport system [Bacillota bacterium]